jgi:SAM-dependent methyltransferase
MNRERGLAGPNSYTRELGFDPLAVLHDRLARRDEQPAQPSPSVAWLDLCCGSGRALTHAAQQLATDGHTGRVDLVGVDLVDAFTHHAPDVPGLQLIAAPLTSWRPQRTFDLITCVHGLHHVGDKLRVLTDALSWLTPDGHLVADLDLETIRLADGIPTGPRLRATLRAQGVTHDTRRHRITCDGRRELRLPLRYLGADDRAGANYTGQPAVDSYYAWTT